MLLFMQPNSPTLVGCCSVVFTFQVFAARCGARGRYWRPLLSSSLMVTTTREKLKLKATDALAATKDKRRQRRRRVGELRPLKAIESHRFGAAFAFVVVLVALAAAPLAHESQAKRLD